MALDLLRPRQFGVGRGHNREWPARGLVIEWSHNRSERAIRSRSRQAQARGLVRYEGWRGGRRGLRIVFHRGRANYLVLAVAPLILRS